MFANQLGTAAIAVLVLVAAVGPAAAAGGQASNSVAVTVQVTDTATVLTVQEDGAAAAGATVSIEPAAGDQFAAAGTYTVDADGTVRLPAPVESTTVEIGVENGDMQASSTVDLQVPDSGTWEQTVSFDGDATADSSEGQTVDSNYSADAGESSASGEAEASSTSGEAEGSNTSGEVEGSSYSAEAQWSSNTNEAQGSADGSLEAQQAAADGGASAWAETRSASKLLGQFSYLFGASFDAASTGGLDATSNDVSASDNFSSVSGGTDGSIAADGPENSTVEADQSGSSAASATSSETDVAADVLGNVVDVVAIDGQLQAAASS